MKVTKIMSVAVPLPWSHSDDDESWDPGWVPRTVTT